MTMEEQALLDNGGTGLTRQWRNRLSLDNGGTGSFLTMEEQALLDNRGTGLT